MNRVSIAAWEVPLPAWRGKAKVFLLKALKLEGLNNWDLSVLFCGNRYIRDLNSRFRNISKATDVLSFPLGETIADGKGGARFVAGDIVVSLDALKENALFFGVSSGEELKRLLVHGLLHLEGHDHTTNRKEEPMLLKQETMLAALAGENVL